MTTPAPPVDGVATCALSPTNDQRFRFLDQFKLTASWEDDQGFTLFWREKSFPWKYGQLHVISEGATLAEATDAAIERWEKKHKRRFE